MGISCTCIRHYYETQFWELLLEHWRVPGSCSVPPPFSQFVSEHLLHLLPLIQLPLFARDLRRLRASQDPGTGSYGSSTHRKLAAPGSQCPNSKRCLEDSLIGSKWARCLLLVQLLMAGASVMQLSLRDRRQGRFLKKGMWQGEVTGGNWSVPTPMLLWDFCPLH